MTACWQVCHLPRSWVPCLCHQGTCMHKYQPQTPGPVTHCMLAPCPPIYPSSTLLPCAQRQPRPRFKLFQSLPIKRSSVLLLLQPMMAFSPKTAKVKGKNSPKNRNDQGPLTQVLGHAFQGGFLPLTTVPKAAANSGSGQAVRAGPGMPPASPTRHMHALSAGRPPRYSEVSSTCRLTCCATAIC